MSITHYYIEPHQINTFVYCPRRYHYQSLHKVFYSNDETEIGKYLHEHHWQNSIKRSELYITSEKWKLKGKIDYIVEENGIQIPIEIKKNKCISGKPYENDVMQLLCYILLLEDYFNTKYYYGYILYKGSKQKEKIEVTPKMRSKLYFYIRSLRGYYSSHKIPNRVEDEKKCEKCSIREYCLI